MTGLLQEAEAEPEVSAAEEPTVTDFPDWMEDLAETAVEAEAEVAPEAEQEAPVVEEPALSTDLPDWMQGLTEAEEIEGEAEAEVEAPAEPTETTEEVVPSEEMPFVPDVPDWMRSLDLEEPEDFSVTDISLEADEAAPSEVEEVEAPDEILLEPFAEEVEREIVEEAPELEEPEQVEAEAPLKPLEEELLTDIGEALAAPVGVQAAADVGELAASQADIGMDAAREFYGVVTPAPEIPVPAEEISPRQELLLRVAKGGLNLLFVILIAIPLFIHYERGEYPSPWLDPSPDEQEAIRTELQYAISNKPPGSIALVSFDYTPATEGEMNPLAAVVVKRLLGQGLRVIAVSLEPEGQAMARTILSQVSSPDEYGEKVLNLGYLPGGPVAVRNLTFNRPLDNFYNIESTGRTSADLYQNLDNWPEINHVTDFSIVVEITANPDTARWWVEQLQTSSGQSALPMMAVVSAAAEPFVRPYWETNQYTALISGINGAAALESVRQQPTLGPASAMLDSQSIAHLIIMILMLFGTIAGLIAKYGQESD
jgi:hypothetical protein